jgi:hypothetical protein
MIIVYESKTGFTKKYADLLAAKTQLQVFRVKELPKSKADEEIIFLGWMKVGKIQGLDRMRKYRVQAVCGSGTGRTAEPSTDGVIAKNKIEGIPFFYLRGGCLPLKDLKGMDRIMLSLFVKMLKKREDKDERQEEAISIVENGFDGVKEENLQPLLDWLASR